MMNHTTKTKLLTALLAIGILVTSACQSIPVSIKGTDAETTTVNEETTLPAGTSEIVAETTVKPTTEPTKATTKATTEATTAATTKAPTPTEKPAPTETTVQPTQTTAAPPPETTSPPPPETTSPPPPPETTAPPATEPPPTTEAPPPPETTPAPTKFREDPDVIREGIIQYAKDNGVWYPDGEVKGGGEMSWSLGYHYSNQEYIDVFKDQILPNGEKWYGIVSVSCWIENDWLYISSEECYLPES